MTRDLPIEKNSIAIIIPALNEAASIGAIVSSAKQYGLPIVIDDCSSDNTAEIAEENGAQVVSHSVNLGYDEALNSGFKRAADIGSLFAITIDADGQHNPHILSQFIKQFDQGADIIIGVRDRRQRIAEHVFAFAADFLWGIKDPLCGLKGYRMNTYELLKHFDSFGSIGTELAIFSVRNKFAFSQIPVMTVDRFGNPRFGSLFTANMRIFRALLITLWRTRFE